MTFTVNSGPGNIGSPNVGDLVCFGGTFHEQTKISAVHGTGPWTINASLRHAHESGSWIMANGPCGEFLDFTANDVRPSGETLHYPLDILGATATNILQYRYFALGIPQSVQIPLGNVNIGQLSANGLVNSGGIVKMNVSGLQNNLQIIGASTVTISGASNSVFNGACTNVKVIPNSTSVTCSQFTANNGAMSASANVALGDSAYGNSDYVLWAGAEVLDVLDYATTPPSLDGKFTLEPNKAAWAANDSIELAHHVSYLGDTIQTIDQIENPMQKSYQGWSLALQGTGINNGQANNPTAFAGISLSNNNSASMYKYHGGMVSPPGGYRLNGIFNFGLAMNFAPDGPGNPVVYVGPPYSGTNDPFYNYPLWNLQGNGNSTQLIYWPNTRELSFSGDPIVLHTDLGAQGFRDNITFMAMASPAVSLTTSGRGGILEHSTNYCYRVIALNSIGNSLPSPERCINTASDGSFNSVTITWNRVIGATKYYIYGRSSGAEQYLNGVNGGESIQFTDDGSTTPRGTMPTQNTSLGALEQAAHLGANSPRTSYEAQIVAPGGYLANQVFTLPMTGGGLASVNSPAFTGTPTAPTRGSTDSSTALATDAFVHSLLPLAGTTGRIGGAPLAAGQCARGIISLPGASQGMTGTAAATDGSFQPGFVIQATAPRNNQVVVYVCAIVTGTPTPKTYNVRMTR